MADQQPNESARSAFTTEADEISLADAQAQQTDESEPDTLDVRSDSLTIMDEQLAPWRRPIRVALVVVAVGVAALVVGRLLTRSASPVELNVAN
jgi:hypothetical protein